MNDNKNDNKYYIQENDINYYNLIIGGIGLFFLAFFIIIICLEKTLSENTIKLFSFFFILWLLLIIVLKRKQKKIIRLKEISRTGVKIEGKIKTFLKVYPESAAGTMYEAFCLIISYIDPNTNTEKEFRTPDINFNPLTDLASKKCDVYIDNDKVYASNFEIDKNNKNCIWNDNELTQYNKQLKLEKKINKITFPIEIIHIIIAIISLCLFIKFFFFAN